MDILIFILVFVAGFLGAFISGLIGGGIFMVTIPALTLIGIPVDVAVATSRFGSIGYGVSSIYKFHKAKKLITKFVIPLVIVGLIGGFIGGKILVEINEELLSKLVGFLILIVLPFTFISGKFGLDRKKVTRNSEIMGILSFLCLAVYCGFFGAGSGIIGTYLLIHFLGATYIEANALDKVGYFPNAIMSTIIFAYYGIINYIYGFILMAGMTVGAYVGAHTAVKKGNKFVKILFTIFVLVSAAKLIFF